MADRQDPWSVIYARQVAGHLEAVDRKYHGLIRDGIEERLTHEPLVETRNRKPLTRPSVLGDVWELRLGPGNRFRIFYQADPDRGEVSVVAIAVKERNRLFIGGEEIDL